MLATAALVPRTQAGGITNNFNTGSSVVVSYQGAGAATTYGANPVTNSFAGPGTLQSVSFTVFWW